MGSCLALCRPGSESCTAGAGISKKSTEPLPQDHDLKAGSGVKRIKVVITKQQLQQLVNKQISLEDVLSEVQSVNLHSYRRTNLDCIPEENE